MNISDLVNALTDFRLYGLTPMQCVRLTFSQARDALTRALRRLRGHREV